MSNEVGCEDKELFQLSMGENHSYIELFARNTTPGWDVWGNEVNKYGN